MVHRHPGGGGRTKEMMGMCRKPLHALSPTSPGEWPSGLYSLRQVTEVKLGRVRSDSGWVTTET